jgi:hypothetical protein
VVAPRLIHVTLYRGAKSSDVPITAEDLSWPALVSEVVDALAIEAPKLDMLAVAPHRLREPHRLLANVTAVTFLAIDVDEGDPDTVRECLEAWGVAALVYESASSTDDAPRFRVLAPTTRPITVAECYRTRFAFAEALGLAPGCGVEGAKDAAKIFFVGRLPSTRERLHYTTEGAPVDVDALLAMPLEHAWSKVDAPVNAPRDGAPPATTLAKAEALALALPPAIDDMGGGAACFRVACEVATVTRDEATTLDVLTRVYNPRCLPPWSAAELRHKVKDAHKKLAEREASMRGVSEVLERHRAAAREADAFHAPVDAPVGVPVLLRSRDGGTLMLWEGDDRGLRPIAKDVLRARVRELGLEAIVPLTDGKRTRAVSAILDDCATYERTAYDFGRTVTHYDPAGEGCVTIGFAPRGPAPVRDADADAWLRALGGDEYPRLEAWLASCAQRHIGRLAATLVLVGAPDVGKSLIGTAAARTWDALPPPMLLVVRQFNGQMLECPVMVDEEAQLFGSKELTTKAFRDLAQATARGVEKKHQERVQLVGAQRYVVPCNDLTDIRFADLGGGDVVQALADRLLVVRVADPDACRAALARLRPAGEYTVDVDRIAGHMAWLGATVDLPVERFVGANPSGASAAVLAGHVREAEELFETLAVWLDGTDAGRGPWYARDGALYVARAELAGALEQRGRGWDLPRVTRALAPFMRESLRYREGGRGSRQVRAWRLDWASMVEAGACDLAALAARLTVTGPHLAP